MPARRHRSADRPYQPHAPLTPAEERVVADTFARLLRGELERWRVGYGLPGKDRLLEGGGCCIDVAGESEAWDAAHRQYAPEVRRDRRLVLIAERSTDPAGARGWFRPAGIVPSIKILVPVAQAALPL